MPSRLTCAAMLATLVAAPALGQDTGAGTSAEPTVASPSFFDDFSGEQLDRERWFVADGWVNGDDFDCVWSADAVRKVDDTLVLTMAETTTRAEAAQGRTWACAEVQTHAVFGHGTYEVRMRSARGSGVMSAFFTYTGPYFDDPHDEIDFEFPGARTRTVELNVWRDGSDGPGAESVRLDFDPTADFNDYAFEWTPDALRWYVNGELVGEVTDVERLPTTPSKIYLNLYNGRGNFVPWLGRFDGRGPAPSMEVAHVAYTAPGDACQFPDSIVCEGER